jgi:hypothetical protein
VIGEPGGVTVIDDFAHHPTAVKVTSPRCASGSASGACGRCGSRARPPSRRNVFQEAYASAFDGADRVIIARRSTSRASGGRPLRLRSARARPADRGVDAIVLDDADADRGAPSPRRRTRRTWWRCSATARSAACTRSSWRCSKSASAPVPKAPGWSGLASGLGHLARGLGTAAGKVADELAGKKAAPPPAAPTPAPAEVVVVEATAVEPAESAEPPELADEL